MSVVTNAILYYPSFVALDFLAKVNEFFTADGRSGFVSVKDSKLPVHWYGGGKNLECELAIGAFNHLDLERLTKPLNAGALASR